MGTPCKSCKYKCTSRISNESRQQIFYSFWSLGAYERQKDFVCSNVIEKKTKTYLDVNNQVKEKRRMICRTYTLECEGQSHHVCKKFFSATSSIGEEYISHGLANKVGGRFQSNKGEESTSPTIKQVKQNWNM